MLISRQYVVDSLRKTGHEQAAETAERELPDPVETEEVEKLGARLGISLNDLISRFGGSP